jgi:Ca-activated chloride channel family protein
MLEGIRAALDYPRSPGRLRLVSFFTDGYIGNEAEILAEIDARLGGARIFSFGAGKAINRWLLEQMAVFGRGAVAIVGMGDRSDDDAAIDAFYEQISHPALADIAIDWNGLATREVFPRRIPDLVVGRPVLVTGRLSGKPPATIRVRGLAGGRSISVEVPVERIAPHPGLTRIWARAGIRELTDRAIVAADARPYQAQIKDVALRHGLASPFTAFIAVDAASQTGPGAATVVPVAVPVPAGVKYERTVAPRPTR